MSDDTPAEISFTWRRVYTFALMLLSAVAVGCIIAKLADADALKWIAIALITENVIAQGFYMAGASIVDYARLAAGWRGNAAPKEPEA